MGFENYRLVPGYSRCHGCAFSSTYHGAKQTFVRCDEDKVVFNYDYMLNKLKCNNTYSPFFNKHYFIYIENTDEAYSKYCTDKLKFELIK